MNGAFVRFIIIIMQQPGILQVKNIIRTQVIFVLVFAFMALLFHRPIAISAFLGAGISALANALLAMWVFRDYRAQQTPQLVGRFYSGEVAKIVLILSLFAFAYVAFDNLNIPVVLGVYLVVQVVPTLIAAQSGSRNMT